MPECGTIVGEGAFGGIRVRLPFVLWVWEGEAGRDEENRVSRYLIGRLSFANIARR